MRIYGALPRSDGLCSAIEGKFDAYLRELRPVVLPVQSIGKQV